MISIALQVLVVVMMIAIGLDLQVSQLVGGLRRGRWVVGAVILNLVVFPLLIWAQTEVAQLTAGMAAGLVLCAAAPAGPIGPVLSKLSKADLGFSTGLMVLLGLLGLATTPLTIHFLVDLETNVADDGGVLVPMFIALLVFQVIPLVAAMAFARQSPDLATRASKPLGLIANLLLVGIVIALLVLRGEILTSAALSVHLNLIGGLLVVLAPILIMTRPGSMLRSLLTVTAVRNMSVALLLAARFFDDPEVEAAILLWSFWMLLLPGLVGWLAGRYRTSVEQSDDQSEDDAGRIEPPVVLDLGPSPDVDLMDLHASNSQKAQPPRLRFPAKFEFRVVEPRIRA